MAKKAKYKGFPKGTIFVCVGADTESSAPYQVRFVAPCYTHLSTEIVFSDDRVSNMLLYNAYRRRKKRWVYIHDVRLLSIGFEDEDLWIELA